MTEYSEYKDSGQQWLGKVPSHWAIAKISTIFDENSKQNFEHEYSKQLQFKFGTIIPKKLSYDSEDSDWSIIEKYVIVKPNDIVINGLNLNYDLLSLRVGLVKEEGIITSAYILLRPKEGNNPSYLNYAFKGWDSRKLFHGMGTGVRLTLSWKELKNYYIPIPPKEEQEAIVAYLDKVTDDIDKAITAKQRIIASLEERRKIIITHAVTRGINPDAPLKGSGIDWLGDIPAHWEVIRIKYLLNEKKVRSKTGAEEPLSMSQRKGLIPTKMMGVIPNLAASYVDAKLVSKGDLVFNKLKAHLGVFNVSEYEGLVSPDYAVYNTTGKADLKFLEYVFKTPNCINEFKKLITGVGSGLSRLYTNDLYSIYCAIPPIDEQLSIRNHIVNQTKAISEAIDQCQSIIDLLRERKNIIINETVTGKVKVI